MPPPPSGPAPSRGTPSVGDIIETMFSTYRATFPTTAAVMALLVLPGLLVLGVGLLQVREFFAVAFDPTAATQFSEAQLENAFTNPLFWLLIVAGGLLAVLGQLAATPALMQVGADDLATDATPSVGRALRVGFRKLWGIAGVTITLGLAVVLIALLPLPFMLVAPEWGVLFILTIPVAIVLALVLSMVVYLLAAAVVVEDTGAWRALGRIRRLLQESFWPTFGRGLLIGLLVGIISSVLGVAGQVALFASPEVAIVVTVVVQLLSYLITTPLGIFGGLALYGDLRVRTEGTDVLRAAGRLAR